MSAELRKPSCANGYVMQNGHHPPHKNCNVVAIQKNDLTEAPVLLRPWIFLYRSVPLLVKLPLVDIDITFSILCAALLHAIRILVTPIMTDVIGWPVGRKESIFAIGGVVAFFHSLLLLPPLLCCLLTQPYVPSATMNSAPRWWQDASKALILLCTGYMLQDSLVSLIIPNYTPGKGVLLGSDDVIYLAHHMVTVSYMLQVLYVRAGHIGAMMLIFAGEFTNPVFNCFMMSTNALRLGCCGASEDIHQIVGISYAVPYAFIRIVLGPFICGHLTYDLVLTRHGRKNVYLPLGIYWSACACGVTYASLPWSLKAAEIIQVFWEGGSIAAMDS